MKRNLFLIILLLTSFAVSVAQRQEPNGEQRQKWLNEIRNVKHDYLVRELNLTRQQQNEFFPIYDQMTEELAKLNDETRDIERRLNNDADNALTDAESTALIRALYEQRQREGQIEMQYFDKFKSTITPRQLLKLKNAERTFTRKLVKSHNKRTTVKETK